MPAGNRGYDIRHEGRLVTVFSASNYCGLQGNWGGLVVFHEPGQYTFKEFMAPRLEEVMERLQPRVLAKGLPRTPSRVFDIMEDDEEQAVEAQSHAVLCETLKGLLLLHAGATSGRNGAWKKHSGCQGRPTPTLETLDLLYTSVKPQKFRTLWNMTRFGQTAPKFPGDAGKPASLFISIFQNLQGLGTVLSAAGLGTGESGLLRPVMSVRMPPP